MKDVLNWLFLRTRNIRCNPVSDWFTIAQVNAARFSRNVDNIASLWKTNVIAFKNASLTEVASVLGRWYNIDF